MLTRKRKLQYSLAVNEALHQMMDADESVFLIGQGVKSPWYVGSTAVGLLESFGAKRVIDTPVSENAITGAAVGAAIAGMRPIVVHPRMDFMLYALDPIINEAANDTSKDLAYFLSSTFGVLLFIILVLTHSGSSAC